MLFPAALNAPGGKQMKDPVLESYLKDFSVEYKQSHVGETTQFEHFVNFCVMSKRSADEFDADAVSAGGEGDLGLDGVGIFVNDHLVRDKSDVDYLKNTLRRLDVEFVFVQAKTSPSFDGSAVGTFMSGVRTFFEKTLPSNANEAVREFHKLKTYIYELTVDMDRPPHCRMYYASTGAWKDDPSVSSRAEQGRCDIAALSLFDEVHFVMLDAERLKRTYREIKNKVVRELNFEKHTILPEISGVAEAYIGVVPALEYIKILCDDDGFLNRRLFYDNVRDFQGHNSVNSEILSTIVEPVGRDRFSLLNNGVTIVAKDLNKIGTKFKLRDFQVVNGCQTSNVIYLAKEHLTENIYLPLKLIVTSDLDVTNQVIQGANRQTVIQPEAFESLTPFQKELEEIYIAVGKSLQEPVLYERRSRQYDDSTVSRDHIVTLAAQIKCFVGMFLNEPHSTHRYYGELLDAYRQRVFSEAHRLMPYVVSGVALANMERLFAEERLPRSYKNIRYQLLMAFRLKYGSGQMPALNSKKMDDYCAKLLAITNIPDQFCAALEDVASIVTAIMPSGISRREPPERTRTFTQKIVQAIDGNTTTEPAEPDREVGSIYNYSPTKGFGFISPLGDENRVFFHQSDSLLAEVERLKPRTKVSFVRIEGDRGSKALDVRRTS